MQNIKADTEMRESISKPAGLTETKESKWLLQKE
jgi:uncharacterized protein YqfA (UPF0365 family)